MCRGLIYICWLHTTHMCGVTVTCIFRQITFVLTEILAKECCTIFYLFYFCILYHMYTSLLHNYWLTHLLACLHYWMICAFTSLPYFLKRFCALLHYVFVPNYSFLPFLDVLQILVGGTSSCFGIFLSFCLLFASLLWRLLIINILF